MKNFPHCSPASRSVAPPSPRGGSPRAVHAPARPCLQALACPGLAPARPSPYWDTAWANWGEPGRSCRARSEERLREPGLLGLGRGRLLGAPPHPSCCPQHRRGSRNLPRSAADPSSSTTRLPSLLQTILFTSWATSSHQPPPQHQARAPLPGLRLHHRQSPAERELRRAGRAAPEGQETRCSARFPEPTDPPLCGGAFVQSSKRKPGNNLRLSTPGSSGKLLVGK